VGDESSIMMERRRKGTEKEEKWDGRRGAKEDGGFDIAAGAVSADAAGS